MRVTQLLQSYKTSPVSMRAGVTKGWALGHSIPERIFKAHTRNYLKLYLAIKAYLDTQGVKILSYNMVPQETTTVISMNVFWYKPVYRNVQTRRSKLFKPWTGWQSRWSRAPLTLWRPRLVQNMTNERKIVQKEANEDIRDWQNFHIEAHKQVAAAKEAAIKKLQQQQQIANSK